MGSSLSEIYSYLKDGEGKRYSNNMHIQLTGIEERKNITNFKMLNIYIMSLLAIIVFFLQRSCSIQIKMLWFVLFLV